MMSNQHIFGRPQLLDASTSPVCHHGVFNAVVRLSHHMAKVSKFVRSNMTKQLFVCVCKYVHLFSCFIQEIRNNFPMHLFSKPGYIVQLGDSAESKFDSIQFTIFASLGAEAIYELYGLHCQMYSQNY